MKDIFKILKTTWTFLIAITGGLIALFNFIQLWQGNQNILTWTLACSALLSVVLVLVYVGFSKISSSIQLPNASTRKTPRYPKYTTIAKISLILIVMSSLVFGISIRQKRLMMAEKVVILIADFYGPEPENNQITEALISQLNETVHKYDDSNTVITPLNRAITEQDGGSVFARESGKQNNADFVIWGRYSIDNNTVFIDFNIENISSLKLLNLTDSSKAELPGERAQFRFRQRFSQQMSAFVLFVSGMANYENGKYSTAYSRFDQSLSQGAWNDDIVSKKYPLEMRGLTRLVLGPITGDEIEASIADFTLAINEIDQNDANLYFDRGFAYMLYKQPDQAIDDFTKAVEINPRFLEALYDRGLMYIDKNAYQKAVEDYTQIIQLEPRSYWAYYQRGVTYAILEDFNSAVLDFTKGIELCPSCADAFAVRGKAYSDLGDYEKAILDLNKAIELDTTADKYYERGTINYRAGNLTLAIQDFSEAIRLDPNYLDAIHTRGMAYRDTGDRPKAIDDFTRAIDLKPEMIEAYFNRANTYYDLGEYSKAILDYKKAVEIEPDFSQAYLYLGHAYKRVGDNESAISSFSKVIDINVQPAEGYCYRGTLLSQTGHLAEGLDDLNKAIALSPGYDEAYYNRGITFVTLKNYPNAIKDFKMVLSISHNPELIKMANGALTQLEALP